MIINLLDYVARKAQQSTSALSSRDDKSSRNIVDASTLETTAMAALSLSPTMSDLLQVYRKEYLPTKARSTQRQLAGVYRRIETEMGPMRLVDLTPAFLRQWRNKLAKTYSQGTVRRYVMALSGPLKVAVRDYEWLPVNPLAKVQKPPEPPGRIRCLTRDELTRLLAACQASKTPFLHLVSLLAVSTGARKNELLTLEWPALDLANNMLRLVSTKNGDRRSLPITGPVLPLLQAHAEQHAETIRWVFPGARRRGPLVLDKPFQVAVKRAGLTDFHFHDLRHTFASYLAMSGASTVEMAQLLGHRQMKMVQKYTHLTNSHLTGVAEKMTRTFLPE